MSPLRSRGRVTAGGFYMGKNPENPAIGDLRVTFTLVRPAGVSLVAIQTGNTFTAYHARSGDTVQLLETGIHSADEMFQQAKTENMLLTWGLRLAGWLLMAMGLVLVMRPLAVLADFIPLAGRIVGAGTGFIAFFAAAVLSVGTVAVAWLSHRPLLAVILGAVMLALIVALVVLIRKKPPRSVPPPPPPPPRSA